MHFGSRVILLPHPFASQSCVNKADGSYEMAARIERFCLLFGTVEVLDTDCKRFMDQRARSTRSTHTTRLKDKQTSPMIRKDGFNRAGNELIENKILNSVYCSYYE